MPVKKILHKTENKFRNKNKRFLFVNLNRNSSGDIKKNTHRAGNLRSIVELKFLFKNSGDILTLLKPYTVTQSLEIFEKLQS
jgi:hypothetical protein